MSDTHWTETADRISARDFRRGDRVELDHLTTEWLSGDCFGTVLANGMGSNRRSSGGSRRGPRVTVLLDRSQRVRRFPARMLHRLNEP